MWIVYRAEVEGRRLKATGSRWSIENLATSRDWVVDLSNLSQRLRYLLEGTGARALTEATRRRTNELVHIEAGVKLIELNRRLGPDRAMITLGGAQGQTLAGAFSTGTHGSDFEHPPLPDLIEAIHLVTTNGEEVWIESSSNPLTDDDDLLLATLPCAETRIIRDDEPQLVGGFRHARQRYRPPAGKPTALASRACRRDAFTRRTTVGPSNRHRRRQRR